VFSDWKAASGVQNLGIQGNFCVYLGNLETNDKLKEAAYRKGIILVYKKFVTNDFVYALPYTNLSNSIYFTLSSNFVQLVYQTPPQNVGNASICGANPFELSADVTYRFVLIPL